MFKQTFHHESLKKYVTVFGTLFNNLWINRRDDNGNVKESFQVPISYSPREKLLARIKGIESNKDPLEQPFSTVVPRIGFNIEGYAYASERKMSTVGKGFRSSHATNEDVKHYQYNPVPYDIQFELSIFVKNESDGAQIIEQILPYFGPEWTVTVKLAANPDVILDIPITISSISKEDSYEGPLDQRRILVWTLTFNMKAYFLGPSRTQKIIKLANTQLFDASAFDKVEDAVGQLDPIETITITPGQTANGEATSNADLTVDSSEISEDEAWDYIVDISGPISEQ